MKKIIKCYSASIVFSLFLLLLLSFIGTQILSNKEINLNDNYKLELFSLRNIFYILIGLFTGYKIYEKGIYHSIMVALIIMIFGIIFTLLAYDNFEINFIEKIISIVFSMLGGSIGVNIPKNIKKTHT